MFAILPVVFSFMFGVLEKIKAGLRVVRTDKNSEGSKEKPNSLGTIKTVEISGKKVDVLWDDADGITECKTGRGDEFELLLFDNSLAGILVMQRSASDMFYISFIMIYV